MLSFEIPTVRQIMNVRDVAHGRRESLRGLDRADRDPPLLEERLISVFRYWGVPQDACFVASRGEGANIFASRCHDENIARFDVLSLGVQNAPQLTNQSALHIRFRRRDMDVGNRPAFHRKVHLVVSIPKLLNTGKTGSQRRLSGSENRRNELNFWPARRKHATRTGLIPIRGI